MKLERFQVTAEPERIVGKATIYTLSATIGGEIVQNLKCVVDVPPYMSEMELVSRMTQDLIRDLKEKYE